METRPGAMKRYWRLAVETSDYLKPLRNAGIYKFSPWVGVDMATTVIRYARGMPQEHHDARLFSRWDDWAAEYDAICQTSPKWRLKRMISQVSETHNFSSWPNRWEQEVWKWAMSDEHPAACPFDDRRGYLDSEFRQRLRALIEEVGGFLYRCEETRLIIFAPTEDLDKIWGHQNHLAEIDRNKPFGFFHDASRPNYRMRPLTDEEERALAAMRRRSLRQRGWGARLTHYVKQFIR